MISTLISSAEGAIICEVRFSLNLPGGQAMTGKRVVVPNRFNVELEEFTIDESSIGPDEVILKTRYTLISSGTELAIYTALDKGVYQEDSWCRYPFRPGYIAVGEVILKGERVRKFEEGELVFCYKNHASIAKLNTEKELCLKVPEGLDPKSALFARMATIAMTSLRKSDVELGDTVAVIGLGLVGNMAAQLFTLAGAEVIGVDLFRRRLEIAEECGIPHVVNASTSDVKEEIMGITSGKGVDLTVEAIGKPDLVPLTLSITKKNGEVILLGTPREDWQTNATEILLEIHRSGISLKGALEWVYPILHSERAGHSIERNTIIAMKLIAEGRLKVEPLLSHVVRPERMKSAYEGLLNRKDEFTGVVIDWTED
ncbi:TPA: zinc-binding alcohol dehydrogenase [Candidatus Poribacteria bacterium]|nr:zinc-binding alcohol dehydrogenase [Candidatus Poribacteria bacterium]